MRILKHKSGELYGMDILCVRRRVLEVYFFVFFHGYICVGLYRRIFISYEGDVAYMEQKKGEENEKS